MKYILYHVVQGLKFLHDHGVLHRSFNAECVAIDEDCEIKIRSWGNATTFEKPVDEDEDNEKK